LLIDWHGNVKIADLGLSAVLSSEYSTNHPEIQGKAVGKKFINYKYLESSLVTS